MPTRIANLSGKNKIHSRELPSLPHGLCKACDSKPRTPCTHGRRSCPSGAHSPSSQISLRAYAATNAGLGRLCVQACPKQRTRCALMSRFPVSSFVDKLLRRITPGNPPSQTDCGQSTTRCTQSGAPDSISETKQSAQIPNHEL
jgi:hypothetical protein